MVTMGQGCGCFTLSDPLALPGLARPVCPGLARPVCPVAINYRPEALATAYSQSAFYLSQVSSLHIPGGGQASCRGSPKGLPYSYHPSMPEITVTGVPPNPPETHAPATSCLTSGGTWAR